MSMRAAIGGWLCRGWLVLAGCATALALMQPAHAQEAATAKGETEGERHILVMLTEVAHPHFRPDDNYGGYAPSEEPRDLARRIGAVNADYGLRKVDHWPMPDLRVRCYLEAVPAGQDIDAMLARMGRDARIESVEQVQAFHTLGHNDPYYGLQRSAKTLQLDRLHALSTGKGVRVAVIDTGLDAHHPDLQARVADEQDFTGLPMSRPEMHGTEVAGILAATADDGVGMVGVAPQARLMALRACWQIAPSQADARCTSFTLAKAVQYALVHGAQVLNFSLSGPPDRLLERLLLQALQRGVLIVAAVDPSDPSHGFPASLRQVLAVRSCTGPDDKLAALSGGGSSPHASAPQMIQAPGTRVLTTTPEGAWGFVTGSSFAAAHVAGMAALMLQVAPRTSAVEAASLFARHRVTPASSDEASVDMLALLDGLSGPSRLASSSGGAGAAGAARTSASPTSVATSGGPLRDSP